jgi:hypothetical protein
MATREQMLAEEALRDFRRARAHFAGVNWSSGAGFDAFHVACDSLARTWHRWEVAAKAAGLDPFTEPHTWRTSAAPATTCQRIPADARLTWNDLRHDGWITVEHETVPDGIRNALLGILGWDEDHSGGVFALIRQDDVQRFALVTWVADGRGDVRQEIAMQVPVCTHDVPLAEGCSVCNVGGR